MKVELTFLEMNIKEAQSKQVDVLAPTYFESAEKYCLAKMKLIVKLKLNRAFN
jgi:hypothetical protein